MPPHTIRTVAALVLGCALATGAALAQERVLEALEARLAANPRDAAGLEELGIEHLRRGDYARAFIQFHKSLAVAPERGTPHFYLGLIYFEKGIHSKEIEAYHKALLRLPEFMPAHLNLAHAYLAAGRIEEAIEQYRWVERRDPRNLTVLFNLGMVFADLNRPEEGRRYLKRFLRLAPADHPVRGKAAEVLAEVDPK